MFKLKGITGSQIKLYAGVVGAIGLGIYQLTQGQIEMGLTTLASALALLGIGGTTGATRAIVDPRVPTPPGALKAMAADSPKLHVNVFYDQAAGETAYQVEAKGDDGKMAYAALFHGPDGEKAFRRYLGQNGETGDAVKP